VRLRRRRQRLPAGAAILDRHNDDDTVVAARITAAEKHYSTGAVEVATLLNDLAVVVQILGTVRRRRSTVSAGPGCELASPGCVERVDDTRFVSHGFKVGCRAFSSW
jgi:hypothetical protein